MATCKSSQQAPMKTKEEYISILLLHANEIKTTFGVKSLRLFGSVSRNENHEGSDVDICVDILFHCFRITRTQNEPQKTSPAVNQGGWYD